MKVLDHLLKAVRDAAVFNSNVQVAPPCILWGSAIVRGGGHPRSSGTID